MDLAIKLIVLLPLVAAAIAGLFCRVIGDRAAQVVTCAALLIAAALSILVFVRIGFGPEKLLVVPLASWIDSGTLDINWSLRVDTLTAVMLIVVTGVSSMVHVYSVGYMAEDPSIPRFMSYLSLFTFFMLMLVTADNLVQLFFGWEGVGLASYLLIGFWYDRPSANAAAIKAFIVNRVGDFGFALGIFAVWMLSGSVNFNEIFAKAPDMAAAHFMFLGKSVPALETACLLLFVGAMGKSAQLGLHTWLPDAMEGPTPVSALIHAATMVTAGVFMVCRLSPMFEYAPVALGFVTFIGAATCFFAATVGTCQWDIKRVIAYSTCSQLGYMFFAAGVGAYNAALFHLFTHAFFKALLFLGAGSVIHAMHHEQDMRYYGALRKQIPFTFYAMLAGTLAITGVGVLGVFGFAGFYSKDAILEAAFASGSEIGRTAFWLGAFAALLTSFYSWRLMFLTFWGKPRWAESEHIQHAVHGHHESPDEEHAGDDHAHHAHHEAHGDGTAGYHPHESPWTMLVPLVLLSLGAIFAGFVFHGAFLEDAGFWNGAVGWNEHLMHAMHEVPMWVKLTATVVMLTGFLVAWMAYIRDTSIPAQVAGQLGPVYRFVYNKWYFDELYHFLFVRPAFWLGRLLWKQGDEGIIDRFGPNGAAWVVEQGAVVAKRFQSGYLTSYALVMLLGLIGVVTWVLF